jgi:2,3-bisphosphoglycerate-independent phosphoglycerate mutase
MLLLPILETSGLFPEDSIVKYIVLIMDGAAGRPLAVRGDKTCLELAATPHLDILTRNGTLGRARTVPPGMEPSSLAACMSIIGYDPAAYNPGRAAIEASSLGIDVKEEEAVFRGNLVNIENGIMRDYSAGHITSAETAALAETLQAELGDSRVSFHPGTGYRTICKLTGRPEVLAAVCTPPHDIPDKPVAEYLPKGEGSELLRDLMERSSSVLRDHPVNRARVTDGQLPATMLWLFWGSRCLPVFPAFRQVYGLSAALTSGVDLLQGMAGLVGIDVLSIPGVTDGGDNDYAAQAEGGLSSLEDHDLTVIHIEAPDEAGHVGSIDNKIEAIEAIDREVIGRIRTWEKDKLRVLVMPDHPTPISLRTHTDDPVPFLLWGEGFAANGANDFSEAEAAKTDLFLENGYNIMGRLTGPNQ